MVDADRLWLYGPCRSSPGCWRNGASCQDSSCRMPNTYPCPLFWGSTKDYGAVVSLDRAGGRHPHLLAQCPVKHTLPSTVSALLRITGGYYDVYTQALEAIVVSPFTVTLPYIYRASLPLLHKVVVPDLVQVEWNISEGKKKKYFSAIADGYLQVRFFGCIPRLGCRPTKSLPPSLVVLLRIRAGCSFVKGGRYEPAIVPRSPGPCLAFDPGFYRPDLSRIEGSAVRRPQRRVATRPTYMEDT